MFPFKARLTLEKSLLRPSTPALKHEFNLESIMAKAESQKKKKRPTALKRDIQNEKRRLINRNFKSRALTALRSFREALQGNNKEQIAEKLNQAYSVCDKGVKSGVFSRNKAARIKSRLFAKTAK
jgi:small subunit ribosomal protein S20